jgi:hypothetical protein
MDFGHRRRGGMGYRIPHDHRETIARSYPSAPPLQYGQCSDTSDRGMGWGFLVTNTCLGRGHRLFLCCRFPPHMAAFEARGKRKTGSDEASENGQSFGRDA